MADVTINNLTGQAPTNSAVFPFSTTGVTPSTYKASLTQIKTALAISWADVSGKPSFATVATSGSYNDLTDKPTIPTIDNSQLAKAWVNFDGTAGTTVGTEFRCTIRSSYNVTKVVRNATGDYSVYFTTPFANTNYCAQVTSGTNTVLASNAPSAPAHCIGTVSTSSIRVHTYNPNTGGATAALVNRAIVNVTVLS